MTKSTLQTMTTLIVYSGGSNTTAVANYIAGKTSGKAVTAGAAGNEDLSAYDTIIIGSRVHAGRIPKDLVEYVANNKSVIDQKKTGFYLCCMYNDDKGQNQVEKIASELGIGKCIFINKAKKVVKEDPSAIDSFVAGL
ncbi:MAG: hypothetical protein E7Z70_08155 [Thermoplasmata archaeon]|nr:hypothetical protein [Thermoplasmata archaeon]